MFENNGKLYNPRMIQAIGDVTRSATGGARFVVQWQDGRTDQFTFETAELAEEQRRKLAVQVDNCNGV